MNLLTLWQRANQLLPLTSWERIIRRFIKHFVLFNLIPGALAGAQLLIQQVGQSQLHLPVPWIALITSLCAVMSTIDKAWGTKKDAAWGTALGVLHAGLTKFFQSGQLGQLLAHIINPTDADAIAQLFEQGVLNWIQQKQDALTPTSAAPTSAPTITLGAPTTSTLATSVSLVSNGAPPPVSPVPTSAANPSPSVLDPRLQVAG